MSEEVKSVEAAKPVAKAPVTKAPVTKAPVTKAPAAKAPAIDPGEVIANASLGANVAPANVAPAVTEVSETASVELPINLDMEETDRNPEKVLFVLKAFSSGCMECSHLQVDPTLEDSGPMKCHFTNGNEHCPARACRIEFVGEKVVFISKFKHAREANDSNRILRLMADLTKKNPKVRDEIMKELGLLS
jgi:hypothetical protein